MALAFILTLPVRQQVISSHFAVCYLRFSFSHSTFLAIPEKRIQAKGSLRCNQQTKYVLLHILLHLATWRSEIKQEEKI